jgi:hypothetical protein
MCLFFKKPIFKVIYVFIWKKNSTDFASAIDETLRTKVSARLDKKNISENICDHINFLALVINFFHFL